MTERASRARATSATEAKGLAETPARSSRPSRSPVVRDMDVTTFGAILGDLLARVPGAFSCALVDLGGETVDYAGTGEPFEVKVAAAHMRIVLNHLAEYGGLGIPRWVVVRGERRSFIARQLAEGYALVVLLRRRAGFAVSERAFAVCERALAVEAGWETTDMPAPWHPVTVDLDRRRRPIRVLPRATSEAQRVEVLGAVMGLPRRERGFRVRTSSGSELTLIRESGLTWYADEDLDALEAPLASKPPG